MQKKKNSYIFLFFFFFFSMYFYNYKKFFFFFFFANNNFYFYFDNYSAYFFLVLMIVSSMILIYSWWYMESEPKKKGFFFYMLFFIFFMSILTSSGNLLMLLIGWESVGVMSFFLIGWWFSRSEATMCASQAMFYNRVGDFFFLLAILLMYMSPFFLKKNNSIFNFFFFCMCVAIMSKSSQMFMHPWLPNAMESPTPVSSLLHSSTMVVASVYMLIRLYENTPTFYVFLPPMLSGMTMLFMSICSSFQKDIKKIIAYSTSSQLSFMIFTVFYISPYFSFFLLFTHSFFKSLLFLVSSMMIHSDYDDQENTRMNSRLTSPLSMFVFTLSSFSLMSIPFFSSFFSKDLILENMWSSVTNVLIILVFIMSCIFTAIYSLNLIIVKLFFNKMKMFSMEIFNKMFLWAPIIMISSVFFSNFFFFFFEFFEEVLLNKKMYFIPLFILMMSFLFFFLKKNMDGSVCKFTFFFNPLTHSFFSHKWLFFSNIFFFLDYFFFEYIIFLKKFFFSFNTILQNLKSMKMMVFFFFCTMIFFFLMYVKKTIHFPCEKYMKIIGFLVYM